MTGARLLENRPEKIDKCKRRNNSLILAHGAGAPADSGFMERLASALCAEGVATVRFEFPYMERRREDGRKRPPDRVPVLLARFREVIQAVSEDTGKTGNRIFIGGKSMGGRMASLLAAEPDLADTLAGCVCFGYPFHPPGKPDRWRIDHFGQFMVPVRILQGTRDPFGKPGEVQDRLLVSGQNYRIHWLEGADHDFRPLARQPETQEQVIANAAKFAARFMMNAE
jgi:uncharacterized protein